jgi:hypothetical protein
MSPYSNISANLANSNYNDILQKLAEITELLPFLINLTAEERRSGLKMGDKSLAFVTKALEYAEANPNLVPPYLDVVEFRKDDTLREQVEKILRAVEQLAEMLSDTRLALGKEEFEQALIFYNSAKQAAKGNVPGVDSIVNDLAERFPGNSGAADDGTPADGESPVVEP